MPGAPLRSRDTAQSPSGRSSAYTTCHTVAPRRSASTAATSSARCRCRSVIACVLFASPSNGSPWPGTSHARRTVARDAATSDSRRADSSRSVRRSRRPASRARGRDRRAATPPRARGGRRDARGAARRGDEDQRKIRNRLRFVAGDHGVRGKMAHPHQSRTYAFETACVRAVSHSFSNHAYRPGPPAQPKTSAQNLQTHSFFQGA